ncbi:hypothetical protein BCR43DRAFT_493005 [Syncephalastrum racemosum]|uniref:Uncharacterized protein n=1 Tax=Syncephalastrum racemosum TaxID=13706 RepID=A0A1X2H9X0_SYNRA|nr:hypothetical protein BCR43DRAFT_493005 [Syncephalastrum racemosum]
MLMLHTPHLSHIFISYTTWPFCSYSPLSTIPFHCIVPYILHILPLCCKYLVSLLEFIVHVPALILHVILL